MRSERSKSRSAEAHSWRERIESGAASRADVRAFEHWLAKDVQNQVAYDRAKGIWRALGTLDARDYNKALYKPALRERFFAIVDGVSESVLHRPLRFAAPVVVFSVLVVVMMFPNLTVFGPAKPIVATQTAQYSSAVGQVTAVTLDDGSVVTLGPDSRIDIAFSNTQRRLTLHSGAAYFDVARDASRPFVVSAGALTAQALGTVFDVRFNAGLSRVAVAEGKVRVAMPRLIDGKNIGLKAQADLIAGEQISGTQETGLRTAVPITASAVGAWRQNRLSYVGGTLGEVIADAARYSGRNIRLNDPSGALAAREVTIAYEANEIDMMLRTLAKVLPITAVYTAENTILIRARSED
ncbi:MAG: FecR domain-containing protein [Pseudomonadota bacterium]